LVVSDLAAGVEDQTVADLAIQSRAVQGWERIEDRGVGEHAFIPGRIEEGTAWADRIWGGHVHVLVSDRAIPRAPVLQIVKTLQAAGQLNANQARHHGNKR
jgi:hypothetical protein